MARKNHLSLHEAIVVALINQPGRIAGLEQIASYIEERNLYPERKGDISFTTPVMLRTTKANGAYHHLFEVVDDDTIKLRNV